MWVGMVSVPFLILYALGIPAASLFILFRRKHKLWKDEATRNKYGFLYLGYRAYYWEIIVMLRKLGMVVIVVFLNTEGVQVQALFALFLIAGMLFGTALRRPFDSRLLHILECSSLCICFTTLWLGSFFWASTLQGPLRTILSLSIIFLNVSFLVAYLLFLIKTAMKEYRLDKATAEGIINRTSSRIRSLNLRARASTIELRKFSLAHHISTPTSRGNSELHENDVHISMDTSGDSTRKRLRTGANRSIAINNPMLGLSTAKKISLGSELRLKALERQLT
jgi:hypothetical protein